VLRGIQKQSSQKEKRRPITYNILQQMHRILMRGMFSAFIDAMLISAFSLAFFAFLRCGEFTVQNGKQDDTLNVEDVYG
jgi:hypothetical protein